METVGSLLLSCVSHLTSTAVGGCSLRVPLVRMVPFAHRNLREIRTVSVSLPVDFSSVSVSKM